MIWSGKIAQIQVPKGQSGRPLGKELQARRVTHKEDFGDHSKLFTRITTIWHVYQQNKKTVPMRINREHMITFHGVISVTMGILPQTWFTDIWRRQLSAWLATWAGKSTTIKHLVSAITPNFSGSIEVDGQDLYSHRLAISKKIGYVADQIFSLRLTANESWSWLRPLWYESERLKNRLEVCIFDSGHRYEVIESFSHMPEGSSLQPSCQIQISGSWTNRWPVWPRFLRI